MNKIAFIIPYFGKFNNYFQLFLNSCKYNTTCDWIIFTDDYTPYDYPKNVIIKYISFTEIREVFQSKFDFKISLDKPYKLCDYKVSYGYVFEEYLSNYKFWGYCDTDLIWGKISNFISEEDLKEYDKIGILGHCTIYKNTKENNRVFMRKLNGVERYKEVFSIDSNCSFDEEYNKSINNIFEFYNLKVKKDEYEANIYTKSSNFKITKMDIITKKYWVEKKKEAFFVWDQGKLIRKIKDNNRIVDEEYLYIHMQSRPMKMKLNDVNSNIYKIIPNAFDDLTYKNVNLDSFNLEKKKYFNMHYIRLRSKNLYKKVMKKIKVRI